MSAHRIYLCSHMEGCQADLSVYIHCLPGQITEQALKAFAEGYGKVLSMRVAVEEGKGSLDGYESRRSANLALLIFDGVPYS